jgi:hypothetical protein
VQNALSVVGGALGSGWEKHALANVHWICMQVDGMGTDREGPIDAWRDDPGFEFVNEMEGWRNSN